MSDILQYGLNLFKHTLTLHIFFGEFEFTMEIEAAKQCSTLISDLLEGDNYMTTCHIKLPFQKQEHFHLFVKYFRTGNIEVFHHCEFGTFDNFPAIYMNASKLGCTAVLKYLHDAFADDPLEIVQRNGFTTIITDEQFKTIVFHAKEKKRIFKEVEIQVKKKYGFSAYGRGDQWKTETTKKMGVLGRALRYWVNDRVTVHWASKMLLEGLK